jgi:hypothetical protein
MNLDLLDRQNKYSNGTSISLSLFRKVTFDPKNPIHPNQKGGGQNQIIVSHPLLMLLLLLMTCNDHSKFTPCSDCLKVSVIGPKRHGPNRMEPGSQPLPISRAWPIRRPREVV